MKVYELLDSPSKWTTKYYAIDKNREPVNPISPSACQWCVEGALYKCYNSTEPFDKLLNEIKTTIPYWNDHSTYEQIIETLHKLDI